MNRGDKATIPVRNQRARLSQRERGSNIIESALTDIQIGIQTGMCTAFKSNITIVCMRAFPAPHQGFRAKPTGPTDKKLYRQCWHQSPCISIGTSRSHLFCKTDVVSEIIYLESHCGGGVAIGSEGSR